jgi:hypothetical protein
VARLCRLMMKLPPPNYPSGGNGAWRGNGASNGAFAPPTAEHTQAAPS